MRIIAIATLIAASTIGFSAIAAEAPQSGQQGSKASTAKPDDLDRVICRSEEDTGSRLPRKKICHTKREWNEITDASRRLMDDRVTHQNNPMSH